MPVDRVSDTPDSFLASGVVQFMKRALLASFIAIFFMTACLALYLYLVLPRQNPPVDVQINGTSEQVDRGRYLTEHVFLCHDCHSKRDWSLYGGPVIPPLGAGRECLSRREKVAGVRKGDDEVPGILCLRNLTPDSVSGLGDWSDGEILRAMREGIGRDGHGLFPIMPYSVYRRVSDEDAYAVIAYLRQLPPVSAKWMGRGIEFPMGLLTQFWPEPLQRASETPDTSDSVKYGAYLAAAGRCEYCHTPLRRFGRGLAPDKKYAGGVRFEVNGQEVVSANLTPSEAGLKNTSREDFIAKFKSHSTPSEARVGGNTPMNWSAYSGMTEEDLGAIYDFIKTRRPVETP
jgi:mono/diheme cytochrome c family protein